VRAVTPAGVAGFTGSANVVTVGTITTGTWQGSAISTAYISNLSGTNTGDEPAASATVAGIVELATTAETTTGTDATRAVTPDGLKDGYQGSTNVTTLGTITTGTWNGSAISTAYISNLSGTNTGDEPAASATVAGIVELATTAETTTGTDTTRAVTPDGLKDGYQGSTNVTTLGTITTGTWNGSVIASAYLDSDTAHLSGTQTFSGLKTFSANVVVSAGYLSVGSDTSGPVGFSVNDGGGNANVWWNERGNAKQTAGFNSARIDVNVDASSGATMNLGVGSGASLATNRLSLTDAGGTFNGECDADTFQEALTTSTGGSYAVNCTTAGVHWRTLNAACTVSFTNTPDSNTSKSITLVFQQDATGGRVITWPTTNWYWAENIEPPQSTGANDIDVYNVQIINNGGTLYYYASLGVKNAS
jgi:hypothetical protein